MKRSRMKSSRPKTTKIRQSARMQDCTFRFPAICNYNPETTVWCHSNEIEDGKGAGLKARDEEGAYGCSACHAFYDGGYVNHDVDRGYVRAGFNVARAISQKILKLKGLMP
ncbi:nuclease domain-containing protein [Solimicrobium silvestre]|uniref:Uncharacterized protein n=1 Tax=Solimicrobium silvestre TaxID=2099400 RepID=A0A2S9GY58_9BURK|nr:nuclease domain-containing protein [Solimicrobium silvestre]PRC92654.1 hypothetical protein S2091_2709 [Solimicrobium silvestre]